MTTKPAAYHAGYEAKSSEIAALGWIAALVEFNRANPPGQALTGSAEGLAYAHGEFQALCDAMPRRVA